MFLELNSERAVSKFRKRKESCCLVFPSSTKREFRHFHVVVGQRRQRNVQEKRDARANYEAVVLLIKPIDFLSFSLPSTSSLLKLPNRKLKLGRR